MILEGNERSGARNLALHLLKDKNEHVTVHDMRGFMADELEPALNEIYAVSRGTKAQKFMFSLSLNPPQDANVSTEDFDSATTKAEKEHGWKVPKGMIKPAERDPKNFTLAQWQQAKRSGKDAREVKTTFQDYWAASDGVAAFKHTLKERGYQLANGNRGFVALDHKCEIYSVPGSYQKASTPNR